MRFVAMFAILAVAYVVISQRTGGVDGASSTMQSAVPRNTLANLPPEMRQLVDINITPSVLRPREGVLPGIFGSGSGAEQTGDDPRPFADSGSRRAVARLERDVRRHLRDVSAFTRRSGRDPQRAAGLLGRIYSARVLAAAGPEGRAALVDDLAGVVSRSSQRVRVASFQGVAIMGDRAIAVLDYWRSVRVGQGSPWRELPIQRWRVALRREGGVWRFERGLER